MVPEKQQASQLLFQFGAFVGRELIRYVLKLLLDDGVRSEAAFRDGGLPFRWRKASRRVDKKSALLCVYRILRCPATTSGACCLVMIWQSLGWWLFEMF